jgi:acyl dehydratase
MASLFYEELNEGAEYVSVARTVTETDVILFAGITGDNNAMHTNEEFAKKTSFGTRIAHGLLTLSLGLGLVQRLELITETALAFLRLDKCEFLAPVKFGDTINAKWRIIGKRETKDPRRGIVTCGLSVYNLSAQGKEVLRCEQLIMIARKSTA